LLNFCLHTPAVYPAGVTGKVTGRCLVAGYWLLVAGCWWLVAGSWKLAPTMRSGQSGPSENRRHPRSIDEPPATSHQPLATSH
jgi:hypothetical protein